MFKCLSINIPYKLLRMCQLSSLLALVFFLVGPLNAHEVRPAIANVTVNDNRLDIEILLTLEALVADLDLAGVQDTDESPNAADYDALRAMDPDALEQAFLQAWPDIAAGIRLNAGETRLVPEITTTLIDGIGNIDLPRDSVLSLSADLPDDASPVVLGWAARYGPLVVRQIIEDGEGYSGYLTGGEDSDPISRSGSAQRPWLTVFVDYIGLGFEHIIPKGLDHILFVLGLFFFSMKLRPLLTQITAFTLAHTVTLALAALDIIQIPASIVEPLIAASIVYVAVENTLTTQFRQWRTAVVFGFGLLHGLGFAAVLGDVGLEPTRFVTGLIGFNIGVEIAQLCVVAAAFLIVGYWFGARPWYRRLISIPASVAIALVGAYWFVERVFL